MKLSAFSILVPDYGSGLAFFRDTLGFDLCEDVDQGRKRWITLRAPGSDTRIVLARADTPAQQAAIGNQAGERVWLFLQTDDFERDHTRLTRAGIIFEEEPRDEPYGRVAVFRDPFGNRWDLICPGPTPL
ncbi:VOC family protein [uncultured Roseobacter sp.]|uniref:VOC family protein n=1 Tax=uncultured Roseobacter sp. TaxID=114847 RepID=UPI002635495A|nr:VOC family protein [uncultured Roseobacter sp.]